MTGPQPILRHAAWLMLTCGLATGQQMFRVPPPPPPPDKFYLLPPHTGVGRTPLLRDFDGDGVLDVAAVNALPASAPPVVYVNAGNGQMFERPVRGRPGTESIVGLAACDVDRDGDADLFAARGRLATNRGAALNALYLNDGRGNLAEAPSGSLPADSDTSMAAAFLDADGDGDDDLFVANRGPNRLYLNDGNGHFTDVTATHLPFADDDSTAVAIADFNGDGRPDLFVGNGCSNGFACGSQTEFDRMYLNAGAARFVFGRFPLDLLRTDGVAVGDVDRDGDVDIALCHHASKARLYLNDGTAGFTDASSRVPDLGTATHSPLLVDVDEDGDLDLLEIDIGRPVLALNDGTGHFTVADPSRFPSPNMFAMAWAAADVDDDRDVDLVVANGPYLVHLNLNRQVLTPPDPVIGGEYRLTVWADAGSFVFAALSLARRPFPIPGWGILQLDPALIASWPGFFMDATRTRTLTVPIPSEPSLRGLTVWSQAIAVRVGGHLTSFMFDVIR